MLLLGTLFVLSCVAGLVVTIYVHHQYPNGIDPSDDDYGGGGGGLPSTGDSVPVGPCPYISIHRPEKKPGERETSA